MVGSNRPLLRNASAFRRRNGSYWFPTAFLCFVSYLLLSVMQSPSPNDALTTSTSDGASIPPTYDPKKCSLMENGHCRDERGGAWSYRKEDGTCVHNERNAPRDWKVTPKLPSLFPDVKNSVLDFGGGLGPYLLSFRDEAKVPRLVTMEPYPLEGCVFRGMIHDQTDLVNTPLKDLPVQEFDLVQTIEVLEHIPVEYHTHVIDALSQATKKWLLFSAAHPGQGGEGHVGPSMKTRQQWIDEITGRGVMVMDENKTKELQEACGALLRQNGIVFRRKGTLEK